MAHNPSMNSQQQHSMMNSVPSSSQRGLSSPNPMYQIQSSNMSQHSHLQQQQQQQQSQIMSGYSSPKPTDLSSRQFSPSLSNMNGSAYQSMAGSSLHSNLNMENSQMNIHHHNQNSSHQFNQPHQSSLQQQQHYQQSNTMNQHQQQAQHSTNQKQVSQQLLQSHQYNMHQGTQNHQQVSQQSPIKAVHQQPQQQQRQQPYIHIQQRSPHHHQYQQQQQPKYDRIQQPRRILQNTNSLNHRPLAKDSTNTSDLTIEPKDPVELVSNIKDIAAAVGNEEDSSTKENKSEVEIGEQEIIDKSDSASENTELANTKEKTPMTLVQELAKFNKIERKYTLLDEQGPAHKKTFYVKLLLGPEEYSSSGASIRKAQQSAAAIALKETQFKHPPQKPAWRARKDPEIGEDGKLTPTVELNGLAMKRGEAAIYKPIEPQQPPYYYPPGMDPRALYSPRYYHYMRASRDPRYARGYWPMRYHYPRMSRAFYVSLRVGHREFIGDGPTRQSARHNAALKALKVLRNLPEEEVKEDKPEDEEPEEEVGVDEADGLKSRVTSVHEIAFRRKMAVNFEVIRESGPPHMKTFLTRCTVGDMVSDGEGNSKKISKKIAAEDMYEKLKALGSLPTTAAKPKPKLQVYKKKNRIKAEIQQQKADPNYGVGVNPISRLIQIMCAQKKKEPVYTLVTERGVSCRKEFIMQIEVEGKTCTGSGPNKKLAKRAAAEAMLELLGYNKPTPQPAKSSFKQPSTESNGGSNGEKKVTFSENCQRSESSETRVPSSNLSGHQQKVPGLLHLPSKTMVTTPAPTVSSVTPPSSTPLSNQKELSLVNLSSILKPNWRPELQLRELCKALNYPLEIDDFSKTQSNNSVEYISRISVGPIENLQNFIGSSSSVESARDMACMDALKVLVSRVKDMHPAGDGSAHMKKSVLSRTSSGMREISQ